jgi:uncharacterized protein YktB (UPF0637 family)
MKNNINEQQLDVKVDNGFLILNGIKYKLQVKKETFLDKNGIWLDVNVDSLTKKGNDWEITASKLGISQTKLVPSDTINIITNNIGKDEIALGGKEPKKLVKENSTKKMKKYIVSETQLKELANKLVGVTKMDLPIGKMFSAGKTMNEKSYNDDIILPKQSGMEQETQYYMFFQNLKQIHKQTSRLLQMSKTEIDSILQDGHDWAADHISTAKDDVEEVYNFLTTSKSEILDDDMKHEEVTEGRKKAGTKLCARGKAAAKAKFKVWPSAYGNGFAVQVCQGRMKGLDGKKRCSPPYC